MTPPERARPRQAGSREFIDDTLIVGVLLTLGEWNGILEFMIRSGMSRHHDTYRSLLMQVDHEARAGSCFPDLDQPPQPLQQ